MPFQKSHGITIAFESSFLAVIRDIDLPEQAREKIDTSHHGTPTWKTFDPADLVDNGELKGEYGFQPGTTPPINSDTSEVVITFPDATTWTFQGFLSRSAPKAPLDELLVADFTVVVDGEITIAAGS